MHRFVIDTHVSNLINGKIFKRIPKNCEDVKTTQCKLECVEKNNVFIHPFNVTDANRTRERARII